jgi:hypothetical protein
MLRRAIGACLLLLGAPAPLHAQSLRGRMAQLFAFGDCGRPLCLDGSVNAANGHGDHFINAVEQGNLALINFLTEAIGLNVANVPVPATSSGATFAIQGGVPVKTSVSAGPFIGERAPTLGRRRLLVGVNVTSVNFTTLRGVPLTDLQFTFSHQDVGQPGLGDPEFENDVIDVRTALDVNLIVTQFFSTYGVTDWLDFGVAVPLVNTSLSGRATAQIVPFGENALHFFAGTPENPVLRATSFLDGSSTGIGDVAVRTKVNLSRGERGSFSLLGDVRLPTGNEDELLGSGEMAVRGLAVASARLGDFTPHLNVGYLYRHGERQNNAFVAIAGFDQLLSPTVTFAADLLTERQVGDNKLTLPGPVEIDIPFRRFVTPTNIPNERENLSNLSVGFKLATGSSLTVVANTLVPLGRAGLRPDAVWTGGLEYTF